MHSAEIFTSTRDHDPAIVSIRGEIVISRVIGASVALVVLPATLAAGKAASVLANGILGANDTVVAQSALTYAVVTAGLGAVLAGLASARFPESRRRICAAWGQKTAITALAVFLTLFGFLALSFLQIEPADPLTHRQLLARDARNWLPAISSLTYIGALAWGLFSPSTNLRPRRRLLRSAAEAVAASLPGLVAAMWFVWQG